MRIRMAEERDRIALRDLDRRAWTLASNPIIPDGSMWMDRMLDLDSVLLAVQDDALLGYVHLANALPAHLFSAAHAGRIRGFAVAPEARGRGIGAQLLRALEQLARRRGYRKVVLQVLSTNHVAQRVYERAGYVCEGRLTGLFYLEGAYVDDLWYAKWL